MKDRLKILVPFDFGRTKGYFLKKDLIDCLSKFDCEVIPLLYDRSNLDEKMKSADGLLIPGGEEDVHCERYGQTPKYSEVLCNSHRAEFECYLLEKFLKTDKPVLGICWGLQLMNVFFGGTLHQHLPSDKPSHIRHVQSEAVHLPTHYIDVTESLWTQGQTERWHVNSTHHQGIDRLGSGLESTAIAEDGLIEGFSVKDSKTFIKAVQWHPERLQADKVVASFFDACKTKRL